jgi:hypothetical protein
MACVLDVFMADLTVLTYKNYFYFKSLEADIFPLNVIDSYVYEIFQLQYFCYDFM